LTGDNADKLAPPGPNTPANVGLLEFGEAGIDLTDAGVFTPGQCESFGRVSASSRSSGNSNTSNMFDIVGPDEFDLQNCGSIKIIKQTDPRGLDQNFGFTTTIAGGELSCSQDSGDPPDTASPFTLNDSGNTGTVGSTAAADNSAANTQDCTNIPAGTYTVTEGDDPEGFTFDSVTCTNSGGNSTTTAGKVATITVVGSGSTTCVYINLEDKQSVLETDQGFIPQDTATITGTGLQFDGSVTFQLRQGEIGDTLDETCENTTDPVVYEETVADLVNGSASTNNSGTPSAPGETDGFTILEADAGSYYWKVFYDGDTDPDVTSCNEVSTLTIDDGEAVSNPRATP